ncbi:MAG: alpha/beta hydrolase [Myxococcales bacterium]|nr:alpha/beta hydrolase [Myxococcales bacterium]
MTLAWLALALGVVALLLAVNVRRPPTRPMPVAMVAFAAGWLLGELPLQAVVLELVIAAGLGAAGAFAAWPGLAGLALAIVSWLLLGLTWRDAVAARAVIEARAGFPLRAEPPSRLTRLYPWWRSMRGVARVVTHPYAPDVHARLVADVYRARGAAPAARPRPIFVYVHGGGWILGFRRFQGRPLLHRLAREGWLCVSVDYRLSPWATFPDHVVDVKRAVAVVREHAAEWGGDPARIVLSGNSAGGHLAALAALTPRYGAWQPGFEHADTSVVACVPCYGIYDLLHRERQWPHKGLERLLARAVLKLPRTDVDAWRAASPWDHVDADAPPFFVVHGSHDTVVPVAEARAFVRHMEREVPGRAQLLEIPGAQHAFDLFRSPRVDATVDAIVSWLDRFRTPGAGG